MTSKPANYGFDGRFRAGSEAFIMIKLPNQEGKTKSFLLLEFLEVAFHSILYFRNIYPKPIFCLQKKYQIPIHVSKHPEVNNYITECLKTAQNLLMGNTLKSIALVVLSESDLVVEKYCFEFDNFNSCSSDLTFFEVENVFRQYLLKLSVANLNELPENCSFRIQISTSEKCSYQLNENPKQAQFPWVEVDAGNHFERNSQILPVKTLAASWVTLNMYIEKSL